MDFSFTNLNFYNCQADQGATIWIVNTLAVKTPFINIYIESSETKVSLLHINSVDIEITNLSIKNSSGRVFFIANSTIDITTFLLNDHKCLGKGNEGCVGFAMEDCILFISNFHMIGLISEFDQDSFSLTNTKISFDQISITNCSSQANTILLTAIDSTVNLTNSDLKNIKNSIIKATNTQITILNVSFTNINSSSLFGIIQIVNANQILMDNVNFLNIFGNMGGCLSLISGSASYSCNISNMVAKNCFAKQGSVFYINDQNISIENSSFFSNRVSDSGGVMYLSCLEENHCQWNISTSFFSNNTATTGGAIHSVRYIPQITNSSFNKNAAGYGPDFSGFPVKLALEINNVSIDCDKTPTSCYLINNITSGQVIPPITISLLDYYNQKMALLDGSALMDLNPDETPTDINLCGSCFQESSPIRKDVIFTGIKTQRLLNGSFNFTKAVIQSTPPSNAWVTVKTDLITKFFEDLLPSNSIFHRRNSLTGDYTFIFKLYFRSCVSGEVYINNDSECQLCPKGQYSFFPDDDRCKFCPSSAECSGGNHFFLLPGYWRPSLFSDDVYQCESSSGACEGGEDSGCAYGYTGILCGVCDYNADEKFFKRGGGSICDACKNAWYEILIIALLGAAIAVFLVYLINKKDKSNVENYVLVKIVTNHLQTVSFLPSIKIDIPNFYQGVLNWLGPVINMQSFMFVFECYKSNVSMMMFELKLVFSTILIFTVILFVSLIYAVVGNRKRYHWKDTTFKILSALVMIAFFFQPSYLNFYFQNLSCDSINGKLYLTNNLEQECWDSKHLIYTLTITIPFLLIWMLLFPILFLVYMKKNQDTTDERMGQIVKFFKGGYRDSMYFWEFIQLIKKFSMILVTTVMRNNPEGALYFLISILCFFFFLLVIFMPYKPNYLRFNELEILSFNGCFLSYFLTCFYLKILSSNIRNAIFIVILISNCSFFAVWIQKYIIVLKGKLSKAISDFAKRRANRLTQELVGNSKSKYSIFSAFSSPKTPKNEKSTPGKAPTKIILRSFHDKSRSPNESDNSASNFRMIFGFGVTKKSSKK